MELEGIYKSVDSETCSKGNERELDRDEDIFGTNKYQNLSQTEARAQNQRGLTGRSKCVVLSTVCFALMCVLVAAVIVLHIKLTAEREIQATLMLQTSSRYQTEKDQLQNSFNSLSQKKLELETRVKDLTAEKSQLQNSFNSLSQKKLELETRVNDLTAEKSQLQRNSDSWSQKKLELETRVSNLTAEKSQLQSSFNSLSQKKLELETRVNDLTAEKSQLQNSSNSLNQKKLELETELRKLSEQAIGCLVASNKEMSWSDSRKYCRDRGGDLVIIKSEKKQRCISSFVKEMVWIGLSDIEKEGNMTWVDNSPLKQGFWEKNEPNNAGGKEDCIELNPGKTVLNNWNDIPCSDKRKCVCEI